MNIAVICERDRGYGRSVCLGIAEGAALEKDWSLEFVDNLEEVGASGLAGYAGVIARIANEKIAACLKKTGLPVVDIYCERLRTGFGSVDGDQKAIGRLAAEYFLERKYKSFAYCGYTGIGYSDLRFRSFQEKLAENGFGCDEFRVSRSAVREYATTVMRREMIATGSDAAALSTWLKGLPAQTAVFCCHDARAWQVLSICKDEGIRVPQRLSVLGVDNDELVCSFSVPAISSIDNFGQELGREAVKILSKMIRSPNVRADPPRLVVYPRGVCERASTAAFAADRSWVVDVLDYISRNVHQGTRVGDVAEFSGRSVADVAKAVKDVTGRTLQDHILWTRIETAKRLLAFSRQSVAEVAVLSGFSSQQYFSRFFKAKTGVTAERYRVNSRGGKRV